MRSSYNSDKEERSQKASWRCLTFPERRITQRRIWEERGHHQFRYHLYPSDLGVQDQPRLSGADGQWCHFVHSSQWKRTGLPDQLSASAKLVAWDRSSEELGMTFKPNVPKPNLYFIYCYIASQSCIYLNQTILFLSGHRTETLYPKTGKSLWYCLVQSLHLIPENTETHGGKITFIKWLITIYDRPGPKSDAFIISWEWLKTK